MSATQAPPPAPKRGLPRPFVALCVLIGVFVGAYAVLTLLSIATASTEHRTRTFRAVGELRVAAGGGDVTIVGERRDDVRVDLEIQLGMWRGAWQPEIQLRSGGDDLRLGSECSVWAHIGVSDCGAAFTIRVPRSTNVVVTDGGASDVRVERLDGRVEIATDSGDVEVHDVGGPLTVDADSGDVEVDAYRGLVATATADSGDVELRTLRAPRSLRAQADSGDITIAVPDVAYRVEVDTDSGDEDVQVADDPRARRTITARTDSGDVAIYGVGSAR